MGIIDSVVSFLRHPIDTIQQAVCEASPQSNSCSTLTAFAQAMDGNQARSLAASTFHAEALPQAPRAPVGCHIVEHRVLTLLRSEILFDRLQSFEIKPLQLEEISPSFPCYFGTDCGSSHGRVAEGGAREVRAGCYIQHMVSPLPPPQRLPLMEEIHTLPTARDYDKILRDLQARQPEVGCYFETHVERTIEPLQPDAGAATPARRRH